MANSTSSKDVITYHVFPVDKKKILVRFENLADRFDEVNSNEVKYLDLNKFAQSFYMEANPNSKLNLNQISIREVSITNN